jgi:chloramphenicol O-acetyltransferase type B
MRSFSYFFSKAIKKLRGNAIVDSCIDDSAKVESGSSIANSTIRRHSFCGYDCSIVNSDIGAFCSIGSRVSIGGIGHPVQYVSTSPVFLSHKDSVKAKFACHDYLPSVRTTIGNDVWIAEGVFVKAGVSVGDGAVIGMGAVVTKNVQPYSIVAGNPATLVRMRFEPAVVAALATLQWWTLPDAELLRLGPLFDDPRAMLHQEGLL